MSFPTQGENHNSGNNAEKDLIQYKKQLQVIYNKKISRIDRVRDVKDRYPHLSKTDNVIIFKDGTRQNLSIKNKSTGIKNGSFDYLNKGGLIESKFKRSFRVHNKYLHHGENDAAWDELSTAIIQDLNYVDAKYITKIFLENVVYKYICERCDLIIIDPTHNKVYLTNPPAFDYVRNGGIFNIEKSDDSMSKIITNFNMRLRLGLNNGKTAWLEGPNNSSLCIKFQQDSVESVII